MISSQPNQNRKTEPGHLGEKQISCSMASPLGINLMDEKVSINAYQLDRKRNTPSQIL